MKLNKAYTHLFQVFQFWTMNAVCAPFFSQIKGLQKVKDKQEDEWKSENTSIFNFTVTEQILHQKYCCIDKVSIIAENSLQAGRDSEQRINIGNTKNGEETEIRDRQIIGDQQTSVVFHNTDSVLKRLPHQTLSNFFRALSTERFFSLARPFSPCSYLQGGHFAPVTHYSLTNPALPSAMNL